MSLGEKLHVACMQMRSTESVEENLDTIARLLQEHQQQGLQLVLLPENATLLTNNHDIIHQAAQKESYRKVFDFFSQQAKQHQIWFIAGSLLIQDETDPNKYFNHCPVFAPDGSFSNSYNKMHLFDADLGSESWQESTQINAGASPTCITLDQNWKLGLSICYDLRFPELYRQYSEQGCNIISVPSSFTVPTGKAHWEVLLRARAIENQSFILAAGQCGSHDDGRTTFGHSMIINPWGTIEAQLKEGEGMISTRISIEQFNDIQKRMPVLEHRRL